MTSLASRLLLIPTEMERAILQPWFTELSPSWRIELCGFGAVAAAATTARLLQQRSVSQVVLLGIAGRYSSQLQIGAAYSFASVTQYGIGVGSNDGYQSMAELGWSPLKSMAEMKDADTFPLDLPASESTSIAAHRAGRLLTVCSAAANDDDRRHRLAKYPDVVAEDMEGYAVAMACHAASVPLQIIRGISNDVGDRNPTHWQIKPALRSAMVVVRSANAT